MWALFTFPVVKMLLIFCSLNLIQNLIAGA